MSTPGGAVLAAPGFTVHYGRIEAPEGEAHGRQIVLEFESFEKAVECYHSPEYQAAREHRLASSKSDIVIVEGAD